MKTLFAFIVSLLALPLWGANPPYQAFIGTNEVVIKSNISSGKIIIGPATAISQTASNAAQNVANNTSNGLFSVETTRNAAVSNGVVTLLVANDTTTSNGVVSLLASKADKSDLAFTNNGTSITGVNTNTPVLIKNNLTVLSNLTVGGSVTGSNGLVAVGTPGGAAGSLLLNASNQVNSAELTANPSSVSNSTTYLPQTALPGVLYTITVSGNTNRMTNAALGSAGQALFSTGTGASFSNLPSSSGFAALEIQTNNVRVGLQTNLSLLVTANLLRFATNNTTSNKVDELLDTVQGIQTTSTPQFLRLGLGLPSGTLDSLTIGNTNQPGYSNYLAGFALNLTNTFAAPTNTHQDIGLRLFGSTYLTGSGFGVATPVAELIWSPTIGAPPAAGTWVFQSRTNISGPPTTNFLITSAGAITAAGGATLGSGATYSSSATVVSSGGYFWQGSKGDIESPVNGLYDFMNAARTDAYGLRLGGATGTNGLIQFISSSTGNSNSTINLRSGNTNTWMALGSENIGTHMTNWTADASSFVGYTNTTTYNQIWNVRGTSGNIVFWNRTGLNGATACGIALWTNTVLASGEDITVGVNCGIAIDTGAGVIGGGRAF